MGTEKENVSSFQEELGGESVRFCFVVCMMMMFGFVFPKQGFSVSGWP